MLPTRRPPRPLGLALPLVAAVLLPWSAAAAQADTGRAGAPAARAWYERLSLRGYAHLRYNRLLETNADLRCAHCDRSIGRPGGFFLRRARLILSGDVHPRVSVYVQPDLATEIGGQQQVLQMRDLYADVYLDAARTLRLRLGQSKVPWGFENVQSSSVRVPLDRADALNAGAPNERDLGLVGFWTPAEARRRYRILTDSGLKGSGDYGVVAVAVMNGQTMNRAEANDGAHVTARLAYPFRLPGARGQFVELGVQGYQGRFVVAQRGSGVAGPAQHDDARVAATLVVYPQPLGLQAEWTAGRGPEFVPETRTIATRRLDGGYVQAMLRTRVAGQPLLPYARLQRYDGGRKVDLDARRHRVRELEAGAEWQPVGALELTAAYVVAHRRTADGAALDDDQRGRLLRLQAQFSF